MIDTLFFDLDGTLTDPKEGITKSIDYALQSFGIKTDNLDTLTPYIGPPLVDGFMEFHTFSESDARLATQKYRERFSVKGLFENIVYPGIADLLDTLSKSGKRLIVATSKPEPYSVKILEHFGLSKYFERICGSTFDGTISSKDQVIRYALESCGNPPKDTVIMIGDRKHDILGAKANGLKSVGVLYGYGDFEELKSAGADYIADSLESLKTYLLTL